MSSAYGTTPSRTRGAAGSAGIALSLFVIIWIVYSVHAMPRVLFGRAEGDWSFLRDWLAGSQATAASAAAVTVMFALLWLRRRYGPQTVRTYALLSGLSMISGLGHAMIIFIVNEAIAGKTADRELWIYYIMGVILFAFNQKIIRAWLVRLSNRIVYEKRMALTDAVMRTTFKQLEAVEAGKIKASVSHDANVVSRLANLLVSVASWSFTIVFGFIYLGIIHLYGMLFSLAVVALTAVMFVLMARSANRLWAENRDIQTAFFALIDDLLGGFRELYLHREKSAAFRERLRGSCGDYCDKQITADTRMAYVVIAGEVLFALVLCLVVFVFPYVTERFTGDTISRYVVVFLYLTGPLTAILNAIPQLMQIRLSWVRMNEVFRELSSLAPKADIENSVADPVPGAPDIRIELEDVTYTYTQASGETFAFGPIRCEFRGGETVFVTGGNGSGKSTLAKLLTGLYPVDGGRILLNGRPARPEELGRHYSAIFSDMYLFDRLYGIDMKEKHEEAAYYLARFRLQDKITITAEGFSTTKLSTGQRKRLALLISYLEDRPVCLFDEWAADQDPEFRHYFYTVVLPDLKARGKCVIAITHDDRYFDCADRVLHMETGQLKSRGSYAMQ